MRLMKKGRHPGLAFFQKMRLVGPLSHAGYDVSIVHPEVHHDPLSSSLLTSRSAICGTSFLFSVGIGPRGCPSGLNPSPSYQLKTGTLPPRKVYLNTVLCHASFPAACTV